MKLTKLKGWSSALCLSVTIVQAQETIEAQKLNQQLKQMQANFEKQQREMRESFERMIREQQAQIDALKKQLEAAPSQAPPATSPPPGIPPMAPPDLAARPWRPTDPIALLGSGQRNYLNLSFDGLFAAGASTANDLDQLQPGGHDPNQRGFTVQNLETVFEGKVDPYFRGQANVVLQIDADGETIVEAEEAFLETMSLPWNLQFKAGQFFTEFGRLNPKHPHAWDFVDQPLVNGRFLGPDGLRNPGARLSWLMPTPFYSELFLAAQNSRGATAASFRSAGHAHGGAEPEGVPLAYRHPDNDRGVKGLGDLLFAPRYAVSFDLTDAQTLLMGASGAFGPNASGGGGRGGTRTQIYGVDLMWKWKSPRHMGGFPFVSWQTEAMLRRYAAGGFDWDENGDGLADEGEVVDGITGLPAVLPRETLTDYGFYTQWLYGFRKGWVAGVRLDYLAGDRADYESMALSLNGEPLGRDPVRARRWRLSPNLTWYPSEFSKFRLQYNLDHRHQMGDAHSVWLQFEFLLGAHAAHKF